jgi:hypothetical protein
MAVTGIEKGSSLAVGINVFELPPERHDALLETLNAINHEILTNRYPMNVSANFHRATDAPIVINYNQYTDRSSGQHLRTRPNVAPLLKRTHDLSEKHEIRWYGVEDVVRADRTGDAMEIVEGHRNIAVVGILAVAPDKQEELLARLKRYGEAACAARVPGFIGLASHRGYKPEHVASYEQWTDLNSYQRATNGGPLASFLETIRALATESAIHPYEILCVTRCD